MIPCLPIPHSHILFLDFLIPTSHATPHPAFYQQLAKLATFHMRFHFTYYIHIVIRWNMVCFSSSHVLLSGRDRLLSFFSSLSSLLERKIIFETYWVLQNIISEKPLPLTPPSLLLPLLLGFHAYIIIKVHQFETGYCLLLLLPFVWPQWPFSACWHLYSWSAICSGKKLLGLITIELHNGKVVSAQCIWAFPSLLQWNEPIYRNEFFVAKSKMLKKLPLNDLKYCSFKPYHIQPIFRGGQTSSEVIFFSNVYKSRKIHINCIKF